MTNQQPQPFDPAAPLALVPGSREQPRAVQALVDYWAMGASRTLERLAEQYVSQDAARALPKPRTMKAYLALLKRWSTEYHWQARIARQVELDTEALTRQMQEERARIARQDLQQADRLRDLVEQALDAGPAFVRRKVKQGRPRIIEDGQMVDEGEPTVITAALDTRFVTGGAKTASDLARRAAGMETERLDVTSRCRPLPIFHEIIIERPTGDGGQEQKNGDGNE
jgi:hypothetical protein